MSSGMGRKEMSSTMVLIDVACGRVKKEMLSSVLACVNEETVKDLIGYGEVMPLDGMRGNIIALLLVFSWYASVERSRGW